MSDKQNLLENLVQHIRDGFIQYHKFSERLATSLSKITEIYKKVFSQIINSDIIEKLIVGISEALEKIPEGTRLSLIILAQNGWYVSLDMPLSPIVECANSLLEGKKDEVDQLMSEYFESHVESIKDSLSKNFPHRGRILNSAFNAHKRGEYSLSVPIFLIQADGICNEIIGIQLYGRKNKKPKTSEFANQFEPDSLMSALLEPFSTPLPITASEKERKDLYEDDILNRHEILHGESFEYDTEINSLKAVSLLNYVTNSLLMAKNRSK